MSARTTTEPGPQVATRAPGRTGPRARCRTSTCRYGVGGSPLCKECRKVRQEPPARP